MFTSLIFYQIIVSEFLSNYLVYAYSVIPRVGPCPPLPPSPPLRPVGVLRGHCRATLALLWLGHNHYCTLGGGLKTVLLVPPPPANRPIYLLDCPVYLLIIAPVSNSWNKYFYCLLFTDITNLVIFVSNGRS